MVPLNCSLCLVDDCYTVDVGGGSWQAEVSWEVVDLSGTIVLSGGAPFTGTLCFPQIFGCTDPVANNYDSLANTDDGSCIYNYGCTDPTNRTMTLLLHLMMVLVYIHVLMH